MFLDIAADRYFALPQAANAAFLRVAAGESDPADADQLSILFNRGLLERASSPCGFPRPPVIDPPARDVTHDSAARAGPLALLRALGAEARAAWQLKNHPFAQVIAQAGRRCVGASGEPENNVRRIEAIAASAAAVAFLTRAHNRCLVRALAVHATCCAQGIAAKLVLGVIGDPFAAHSWVQLDDWVVVGGFEQARLFTPILVIE